MSIQKRNRVSMKYSSQHALTQWYSAMHHLLRPHFVMPARRLNYLGCNDIWPTVSDYPQLERVPKFENSYLKHPDSESVYSVGYPLFLLSESSLKSRFNQPFRRLLDEYGLMGAKGVMLFDRALVACYQETLSLIEAICLDESIDTMEAVLLRNRLYEYLQYQPDKHALLINASHRLGLPDIDVQIFMPLRGATTNAKGIKNTIEYIQEIDQIDQLVTAMLSIRGLLNDMPGGKITRLLNAVEPVVSYIDHPHPAVRDLALVNCNTIAKYLFEHSLAKKPEQCLRYISILLENHVDPDINLAQKSIVEAVLGDHIASDESWNRLIGLVPPETKLPEPRYHRGEYPAEEWRRGVHAYLAEQGLQIND